MLTQKKLKKIVNYDPISGLMTKKNKQIGTLTHNGYLRAYVDGKLYMVHRLIFLYMEGSLPKEKVDHIDHNRTNNIWSNLRHSCSQKNQMNRSLSKDNKSGYNGVTFSKKRKKWIAQITINKKKKHLGIYSNINDAVQARQKANIQYGFHCNHGK